MKKLKLLSCLVVAIFGLISCNKNESYRVTFPQTGFYFKWGGSAQTVSYSKHNITSVEVTSVSDGWTCVVNAAANTVTITPPEDPNDDEKRESSVPERLTYRQFPRRAIPPNTFLRSIFWITPR